ncbi:hypothetical protein ABW18_00075 [Gordonia jacobaea]|uniref:Uncharacterized protein n=1 Tax=Gordonia jacobaea TaxID=122202 RepID=A0ABR5IH69_9ACTN|nr:hypothetical protein ABW18_00075 [Gordonia jacobaea]
MIVAKLQANAKIQVRHNRLNKRYVAEIIDYRKSLTFGFEPLEAIEVAEQLMVIAANYEQRTVIEAVDRIFDQIDSQSSELAR